MIRTQHNPPMDKEDIVRFRRMMRKHLTDDYTAEERREMEERKARGEAIYNKIIENCGGVNPILGY